MKRMLVSGLILSLLMIAGSAFAEATGSSVETQFNLAQKFMERAGLVGTAPADEPAPAEEPAAEPAEDPAAAEESVEETMPQEIAAMVAERHAFIGWAKMNGLPASRNIQNQELWGTIWGSVKEQVAAGVTVQEAMAAVQAGLTEEQLGTLESLKETPPGKLEKAKKGSSGEEEVSSAASAGTGKGKGKGEGKGSGGGKGEGKGEGKGGKNK